jgi:hypothetical protein
MSSLSTSSKLGSPHCELGPAGVNITQGDLKETGMGLNKLAQEDPAFGYSSEKFSL